MENANIDELNISGDFIITADTSNPEAYDSTGKYMLDKVLIDKLDVIMYSVGLDSYLLKKGSFNSPEYKKYLEDYHKNYLNGELKLSNDDLIKSYDFFKKELEGDFIFYKEDNVIYNIEEDIITAISKIIGNSRELMDEDNYKKLIDFINHVYKENDISLGGR